MEKNVILENVNATRKNWFRPTWTWFGLLALIMLFAFSVFLIRKADDTKPADWNDSRLTYLPSGKILKPMVMDLDEAVAAIFWIYSMQYFADAYLEGKSYRWIGQCLDIVTLLNPRFRDAYEFGGVVLTKHKAEIPKTLLLLDRGIGEFPTDWKLRLYAAIAQLSLDSNFVKAAEYLKPVSLAQDVPDHIRTLAATFLDKGGDKRIALAFLADRYIRSENSINREIFVKKILKLYPSYFTNESKRQQAVEMVLHEVTLDPKNLMLALGVIHEYLSGNMSPTTKNLIDMLIQ